MLARPALSLALLVALAGPAVAPSVLNLYEGRGTLDLSLDGTACGPADSPIVLTMGTPNAANERISNLVAPGEGGFRVGSGTSPEDPLVAPTCLLVWSGVLTGTASTGFVGASFHHLGPDPDCDIEVTVGAVGAATPIAVSGCGGALVGSGTLDFSPFLTG